MSELDLDALLARTTRRNFRTGRMTVRTLLDKIAELQTQVGELRAQLEAESVAFYLLRDERDHLTGQVVGRDETIQRVRELHREWVLYDEDACTHQDDDHDVFSIAGVGNVCADTRIKSLCRECCTDDGEFQSRHCVEDHAGTPCWPCPTKLAIDGEAVASRA